MKILCQKCFVFNAILFFAYVSMSTPGFCEITREIQNMSNQDITWVYKDQGDVVAEERIGQFKHSIISGHIPNGRVKQYYENGEIFAEWPYKRQKLHGKFKIFHENGSLMQEGKYRKGMQEGLFLEYHLSGKIKVKGQYKSGRRIGEWHIFYQNGALKAKVRYQDGKLAGYYKIFDQRGNLADVGDWDRVNRLMESGDYQNHFGYDVSYLYLFGKKQNQYSNFDHLYQYKRQSKHITPIYSTHRYLNRY